MKIQLYTPWINFLSYFILNICHGQHTDAGIWTVAYESKDNSIVFVSIAYK